MLQHNLCCINRVLRVITQLFNYHTSVIDLAPSNLIIFNPLYSDGYSHTDTYNKDGIAHYTFEGFTG